MRDFRNLTDQLVVVQNGRIEGLCRDHPGRLVGLGAISMQFPDLAERQLAAPMARGLKGIEVSSLVGDRDLAESAFDRLWNLAAENGAVVFVHPLESSMVSRPADDYLANVVGQPTETAVALSKLIFAGVLDRHRQLKLLAARGGGYLQGPRPVGPRPCRAARVAAVPRAAERLSAPDLDWQGSPLAARARQPAGGRRRIAARGGQRLSLKHGRIPPGRPFC